MLWPKATVSETTPGLWPVGSSSVDASLRGAHYDHQVAFLTLKSEFGNLRAQAEKESSSIQCPRLAEGPNSHVDKNRRSTQVSMDPLYHKYNPALGTQRGKHEHKAAQLPFNYCAEERWEQSGKAGPSYNAVGQADAAWGRQGGRCSILTVPGFLAWLS